MGLESEIVEAVNSLGFEDCTPIQASVIPHAVEGRDISGLAQTGTGKTAAFLIPLINRIILGKKNIDNQSEEALEEFKKKSFFDWHKKNFVLILVPTRELADQVHNEVAKLKGTADITSVCVVGGSDYESQKSKIAEGADFIIATPGRLIDLFKSHAVDLKQVRAIVFDEADRMFDMGFKDDMRYLLRRIPENRQFILMSATTNFEVMTIAYQNGADPVECHLDKDQVKAENVKDQLFHVGQEEKPKFLYSLIKKENAKQVIIFSNYRRQVEQISEFLIRNGYPTLGISSLLNQKQRNRVIEKFKEENGTNIMVATDLAARGLDIKGVDLVINFDLPDDSENYVHRIGRTGRAGREGIAYSLVSDRDVESLSRLENYLKHKLEIGWIEDSELVKDSDLKEFPRAEALPKKKDFKSNSKKKSQRKTGTSSHNSNQNNKKTTKKKSKSNADTSTSNKHKKKHVKKSNTSASKKVTTNKKTTAKKQSSRRKKKSKLTKKISKMFKKIFG